MEIIEDIKVEINRKEVLRLQGYKKDSLPGGEIAEILDSEIEEGYNLIAPRLIHTEVGIISMDNGIVKLNNNLVLKPGSSVEDWENASSIGMAICTIGPALERRVGELFSLGDYPSALMLDCVGTVAVSNLVDSINYIICERANESGARVGARNSPGIGKWELSQQTVIFQILDGSRIGVSLNAQYMMIPQKSRSLCLGIGKELISDVRVNSCRRCGMKNCPYRKTVVNS